MNALGKAQFCPVDRFENEEALLEDSFRLVAETDNKPNPLAKGGEQS